MGYSRQVLILCHIKLTHHRPVGCLIPTSQGSLQINPSQHSNLHLVSPLTVSFIIPNLGLVAQSVEQRIENPCVGGSIPPRATKNLNSPLVGLFSFMAWQGWESMVSDIPIKNRLLKGRVNYSSLCQSMSFKTTLPFHLIVLNYFQAIQD